LQPGRDGVGDYTRTLAAECARRGHDIRLLAVADTESAAETTGGPVRRMTRAEILRDNGAAARRWLDEFKPDWTSLQFVPYSFDPRGLFAASIPALVRIAGAAPRRQIFFHEIWIGANEGAPLKSRLFGALQRRAVARLLHALAPRPVHTSTDYYRSALERIGVSTEIVPMFGSVPWPGSQPAPATIAGVAAHALVGGMFGTLHPDWQPGPFMHDFAALAGRLGRPAALVSVGGIGPGAALLAQLTEQWRDKIACVALGRRPEPELATIFARFDFAVTTVPWNILGKSSSAAALREHGVQVAATHPGDPPRGGRPPVEDLAWDSGMVPYFRDRALLASAAQRTSPRPGVGAAATRFLDALAEVPS